MTRKSCAVGMCNAIPRNYLKPLNFVENSRNCDPYCENCFHRFRTHQKLLSKLGQNCIFLKNTGYDAYILNGKTSFTVQLEVINLSYNPKITQENRLYWKFFSTCRRTHLWHSSPHDYGLLRSSSGRSHLTLPIPHAAASNRHTFFSRCFVLLFARTNEPLVQLSLYTLHQSQARTFARKCKPHIDWSISEKGMYVGLKQPRGDGERYVTPAQAAEKETNMIMTVERFVVSVLRSSLPVVLSMSVIQSREKDKCTFLESLEHPWASY